MEDSSAAKAKLYHRPIALDPIPPPKEEDKFDLCFLTYYGKLTTIVAHFNKLETNETINLKKTQPKNDGTINKIKIEKSEQEVREAEEPTLKRTPLHIASYLNFQNIFYYLLSYNPDIYKVDDNQQSIWHFIAYRGHTKLLALLFNFYMYKIKLDIPMVDNIKKSEIVDSIYEKLNSDNTSVEKNKIQTKSLFLI